MGRVSRSKATKATETGEADKMNLLASFRLRLPIQTSEPARRLLFFKIQSAENLITNSTNYMRGFAVTEVHLNLHA